MLLVVCNRGSGMQGCYNLVTTWLQPVICYKVVVHGGLYSISYTYNYNYNEVSGDNRDPETVTVSLMSYFNYWCCWSSWTYQASRRTGLTGLTGPPGNACSILSSMMSFYKLDYNNTESVPGSSANTKCTCNGHGLACPPYNSGKEAIYIVCTKQKGYLILELSFLLLILQL